MKDLKLRAWHKIEEKMCEVDLIRPGHGAFLIGVIPEEDQVVGKFYIESQKNGRYCLDFEFELIQFTGLKDKEGTEIYEGNIVEIIHDSYPNEYGETVSYKSTGEVIFMPSRGFCLKWIKRLNQDDDIEEKITNKYGYITQSRSKVVGNIYKNPELLNKQT